MSPGSFTPMDAGFCIRAGLLCLLREKRNEWVSADFIFKNTLEGLLAWAYKRKPLESQSNMREWRWRGGGGGGGDNKVPLFIQREKKSGFWNQNPHLCNLFTIHHTFSTEGRGWTLWSYEETNAALGYPGFAFFSEWGRSSGLSLLVVHPARQLQGWQSFWAELRGGGIDGGHDKVASQSFKSKCCSGQAN